MDERMHILADLKLVAKALEHNEYVVIKQLSNTIIDHVTAHQDPDLLSVAVIVYALSKLIEREQYKDEKNWKKFYVSYCGTIASMISSLEKNDDKGFRKAIAANRSLIVGLGGKLHYYISDVITRARMNKASQLYEKGISMEKTANALGISLWELSEYMGPRSEDKDNLYISLPLSKRIALAKEVFG